VDSTRQHPAEPLFALLATGAASALVALGLVRGLWVSNLHNGVLAVGFSFAGAMVLLHRPGHREARLFLVIGLLSGVVFAGRQIGLSSTEASDAWWGWLGVWPTALAIALTTWVVLCFPEGRFLSPWWRRLATAGALLAAAAALLSALWPVEYDRTQVTTPFPFTLPGASEAGTVFDAFAYPTYALLQLLWLAGLITRWRGSDSVVRRQLLILSIVVGAILVVLYTGLAVARTPTPGLLTVGVVPVVAGWLLHRWSLAHVIEIEKGAGRLRLAKLTPRENEVLDLMAQGLANTAIADRLHLSIKTVEPAISSIFRKLGLPDDPESNRRVLAVAEYWARAHAPDAPTA
jgi:DNA-binding CsgD family transcriptional regulator